MRNKSNFDSHSTPGVRVSQPASRCLSDFNDGANPSARDLIQLRADPNFLSSGGFAQGANNSLNNAMPSATHLQNSSFLDYSHIQLKPDHEKRPLWIGQDSLVLLEAFSPLYKVATDFLVAIAEPASRPTHIHEYRLTKYSLYAAASIGLSDTDIIQVLQRLSKNQEIPVPVVEFIMMHSSSYGKAKLVLKNNQYIIEAVDLPTIQRLTSFECIKNGIRNQ